jgi:nucleotide-binding universal stress UspA family protein
MNGGIPKVVLLATDLTETSAAAAAWAGLLAHRFGAQIKVVHAEHLSLPPYFSPEQHARLEAEARAARARAQQLVAESVSPYLGFVPEAYIAEGHPADAIVACARDCNADLVITGTHGRRGMRRLWLGSVAEAVLHDADRAVLVIHGGPGTPTGMASPPAEVVLACEPLDIEANRVATAWALAFGAPLQCRAPDAGPGVGPETPALYVAAGDHPERGLRRTTQPFLALPRRAG